MSLYFFDPPRVCFKNTKADSGLTCYAAKSDVKKVTEVATFARALELASIKTEVESLKSLLSDLKS